MADPLVERERAHITIGMSEIDGETGTFAALAVAMSVRESPTMTVRRRV
jgi:hypothetical protein